MTASKKPRRSNATGLVPFYSTIKRYDLHVVRERVAPYTRALSNSRDVAALLTSVLGPIEHERLLVLMLDSKNICIGYTEAARGGMDSITVVPRDVLRVALHAGARSVILGHNHPSDDPAPSDADIAFTERVSAAAALIGIDVLDHIITTTDPARYVSLADTHMMPRRTP